MSKDIGASSKYWDCEDKMKRTSNHFFSGGLKLSLIMRGTGVPAERHRVSDFLGDKNGNIV